ncbi:histidine phosphatase family protein [Streptomonospora nanhaiensis]|uniref:Histidine phosphatase family protein n=1 Tax=Streptomonospora nanhaiensis TaxID=1323731 RepID=A0ABY6YR60_9ACTN|nr:histidine phosphatase family protein [Streptomonospora nanhaiensis]WAE74858.1 histidine phosphatase family protein [Streptomonospora nanhaiensis]
MSDTPRVLFWRHGRTAWNVENRFQGQTDIELDQVGHAQARRAGGLLASLGPDVIVASDLKRAADTAGYLSRATGVPIEFDKGLRERFGGSWEGRTGAELSARWPSEHARMAIPDGEPISEVGDRMRAAVDRGLARTPAGGLLVVVSHGAAVRIGIARMLGIPDEQREILGPLSNCSWSVLQERRGQWRLMEHNAASLPEPVVLSDDA